MRFDLYRKAIISFTLMIVIMSLLEFAIWAFLVIFRLNGMPDDTVAIVVYIVILFALKLLSRWLSKVQEYFSLKNHFVIGAIGIYVLYLISALIFHKKNGYLTLESALFIGIYGVIILLLACFWQKDKVKMTIMEKDQHIQEQYYDAYTDLIDKVRKNQHDFHNHLQAILGICYSADNFDDLVEKQMEYSNQLIGKNFEYKLLIKDWVVLTGFLNTKFSLVLKKNIIIYPSIKIQGKIERIPEFIIIEVLGILIDNAIEAVEHMEHPIIYFDMYMEDEKFMIKIVNPIDRIVSIDLSSCFEKGYSTKAEHSGYGLSKIREYSIAYEFEMAIKITNIDNVDYFSVLICI